MSDLDLPNFDQKKSGITNEDGAQLILQCEAWFQARMDLLNQTAEQLKSTETIALNGTQITDPNVIKGMRLGFLTAVSLIGEFPLKLGGLAAETD